MNQHLQNILNFIQQGESLTTEQKNAILKSLKEADKELEITTFKLDRTEKVKRTTAILLEETIEELEQKRKAVEAQNRELEIETSLEKVRAVAMGMRQPEDMLDVCRIISQQLDLLNVKEIRNVQTAIFNQQKGIYLNYEFFRLHDKTTITEVEYNLQPDVKDFVNQMLTDPEAFFTTSFEGAKLKEWLEYQQKANQFVDPHLYEVVSLHYYFYSIGPGALGVSTYAPLNENELAVFKRFRNVFELAYRRFIDIQKAETQAREAQIEAALEKVRSRSLAMHKSDELQEVVNTVFDRLKELDIEMDSANIAIFKEGTRDFDYWVASPFQKRTASFHMPYIDLLLTRDLIAARESGTDLSSKAYSFEEKNEWFNWAFKQTDFKLLTEERKQFILDAPAVTVSIAFSKYTGLQVIRYSTKLLSEAEAEVLKRFSKVFEQAYTRFLDLQKAEAQAREAQIETALERVRSRSMGMQKSDELREVIQVIYEQLIHLNFNSDFAGFAMDYRESNDWNLWAADSTLSYPEKIHIPYLDHPQFNCFIETREKGLDFQVNSLTFDEKNKLWDHFLKYVPAPQHEIKDWLYNSAGLATSWVLLKNVTLYVCNTAGIPFSDAENATLKRFGKVFEQTYTRFNDLKQAEAQAREAQIEASLERVRSKTMAMHNSQDVGDTVATMFDELVKLGVETNRCGILIYSDTISAEVWTAKSNKNEKATLIIGQLDLSIHPLLQGIYDAWKNKESFYTYPMLGDDLKNYYQAINDSQHYPTLFNMDALPEKEFHSDFFFTEGSIFAFTTEPIVAEAAIIFKRFAGVFGQTYRRYLDLQKAEAQAREAQIELGLERVRARAMAMQKSDDLARAVAIIFEELGKLDIGILRCGIGILNKENRSVNVWTTSISDENTPVQISGDESMDTHPLLQGAFNAWLKQEEYSYVLHGKDLTDYYKSQVAANFRLPDSQLLITPNEDLYQYYFLATFQAGGLFAFRETAFPDEAKKVMKRFAGVFNLTYKRFLDLKKAEAQARESQIQLALERARTQSMLMQYSKELDDTLRVFHEQILLLGINSAFSFLWLPDENKSRHIFWAAWAENISGEYVAKNSSTVFKSKAIDYPLDRNEPATAQCLIDWKSNEPVYSYHVPPAAVENYFAAWQELIDGVETLQPQHFRDGLYYVEAFMKYGCFGVMVKSELLEDEKKILARFAIEFERAYTRFLDLQKAEAQAREAKIEAALEKVRAKAMSMHSSEDLTLTISLFFAELRVLNVIPHRCGVSMVDEVTRAAVFNATTRTEEGQTKEMTGKLILADHPVLDAVYDSWKKQKEYHPVLQGDEIRRYYQFMNPQVEFPYFSKDTIQFGHYFPFKEGFVFSWTEMELKEEELQIFRKFTSVLSLTHRRYMDLKEAEEQARESQIEAALERVRSRSMGMQKSEELKEVIQIVYDQFVHLNIKIEHTGFVMDYKARDDYDIWVADPRGVPSQVIIPYFDSVYYNRFNEAKKNGEDFFATNLSFEEKNKFYQKLFEYIPRLPEEAKEFYFSCPGLAASTVLLDNICLYIENFSGTPYSDEENKTLMRFGKVFQQTYTRFLDLQKAEAQAREAKIEAALEKVRSRTMAMQRSAELAEVATVLFQQVKALGVPQWVCGFSIFEIGDKECTFYPGSADGEILEPCKIPLTEHPVFISYNESRKRGDELFVYEKEGEFQAGHYRYMMSLPGMRELGQKALDAGLSFPTFQIDHIANFSHGNLIFITYEHFPEMHDIFKRFAKVFDQTYTRFLDLQKAEAQAREAIKQASVDRIRAEIASMRTTNDLERIQPLIWNELKTLGVPFIRCGVFIMDEEKQETQTMLSTPEGKAIATLHVPFEFDLTIITNGVKYWRKKEVYKEHWDDAAFTKNWLRLSSLRGTSIDIPQAEHPPESLYLHLLPFLQGMLYVGSDAPLNEDELNLVQNLADAFSTAYARYEDFNKLETAKKQVDSTLNELQVTQKQLIQSEKMASLGELTAGIAHEIQNPLNFVNNFSEVSTELLDEMITELGNDNKEDAIAIADDVKQNLEKILHHGKRADGIVKGMLQHSRSSSAIKEPTDINTLADEYLRLAYHGLRAKDKTFNAKFETDFDESIGQINIIPQDIGRVLVNLINNAFYAVTEKRKKDIDGYEPTVTITTKKIADKPDSPDSYRDRVELKVIDNGNGIPQKVLDKIFQPFFTTKPTGQGTGLGLSLSYDIIKAHAGEIKVETKEGEGTEFIIQLPVV